MVVAAGESAVDGLVAIVRDRKLEIAIRIEATNALGDIGSKKAVATLLAALRDPDEAIRQCAAISLGKIGDQSARPALLKLSREDRVMQKDPATGKMRYVVRDDARKAIRMLDMPQPRPEELIEPVRRFRSGHLDAYNDVVAAGEEAVAGLAQMVGDERLSVKVRYMAANALGDIGSNKAVKQLVDVLEDHEFLIRRCAVLALGRIGDASARPALERLAREDWMVWQDPATGKPRYLIREDAKTALEMLSGKRPRDSGGLKKGKETFLDDASKPPPCPVAVPSPRAIWPFPGHFKDQNVWNNYQQPTDVYIHGGLDLIHKFGTEVRAVEGGYVAGIATSYPEWKTHHFFVVSVEKDGTEGWCYTHVDPDSCTFKVGDKVAQGQVLGKLVDFYVGKNKGADHLHLHYVRFQKKPDGKIEVHSLFDPLLRFEWEDTAPPRIVDPLRLVRKGTLDEFTVQSDGLVTVSGRVEIIAGISDNAYADHACNWMTPVVTLEIVGEKSKPWRKLVLDGRGPLDEREPPTALYLTSQQAARWAKDLPRFPQTFFLKVTSTDGDGIIQRADALHAWETAQQEPGGGPRYPDGVYTVTVRAWDLKGNQATRTTTARVKNSSDGM